MKIDEKYVEHLIKNFQRITKDLIEDMESKDELDRLFAWNRIYMIMHSVEQHDLYMKLGVKTGVRICELHEEQESPSKSIGSWKNGTHPLYEDDETCEHASDSPLAQLEGLLDALIKRNK